MTKPPKKRSRGARCVARRAPHDREVDEPVPPDEQGADGARPGRRAHPPLGLRARRRDIRVGSTTGYTREMLDIVAARAR